MMCSGSCILFATRCRYDLMRKLCSESKAEPRHQTKFIPSSLTALSIFILMLLVLLVSLLLSTFRKLRFMSWCHR